METFTYTAPSGITVTTCRPLEPQPGWLAYGLLAWRLWARRLAGHNYRA